jgi:hypothetical protein
MRYFTFGFVAAGCTLALGLVSAPASAEVPERPTFTKDVLPIFQEQCQTCHRSSPLNVSGMVAPFPLTSYNEVRPWAKAIAKAVSTKQMPPWFATDEFHGVFQNERTLTDDQIQTIVRWVETGAARGNPSDAPEPVEFQNEEWYIGTPDLIVEFPEPVWVGDDVQDWQPNINIPLTEDMLPGDRWIRSIEAQAGSSAVHHIVVYSTEPGGGRGGGAESFGGGNIGGLAPGAEPRLLQDGYGIRLAKGTTLRVNMHYNKEPGPGTGVWDHSRLGFFFYPKDQTDIVPINIEPIGSLDFEIPPGQDNWVVGMARTFDRPIRVLNYLPHMHVRGTGATYTAFYPDGTSEKLLEIPTYDYNWQLYYEYPEPKMFPAGTRIEVQMIFDNSINNPSNPDPTVPIRFGIETTTDEMALGWMYYSWADEVPGGSTD